VNIGVGHGQVTSSLGKTPAEGLMDVAVQGSLSPGYGRNFVLMSKSVTNPDGPFKREEYVRDSLYKGGKY
jgi:hypothetical protein